MNPLRPKSMIWGTSPKGRGKSLLRAGHGSSMASVARSMLEQYFAVGINSSDVTANENQVS